MKNSARPFLKWAGGKSKSLVQFEEYYPQKLVKGNIKRYVEPFLGGGAVFFSLQCRYDFNEIVLNDINEEVILTYKVIQNDVDKLIEYLLKLETRYLKAAMKLKQEIYYEQRDIFNSEKDTIDYNKCSDQWIGHAARMIFLNKTCFNGLYRQNKQGKYNVPFGKRKKVTICDSDNLKEVNKALENVTLVAGDFEKLTKYIDENTFFYIDPPYRPLSTTSSFTDYSKVPFNDESQKRLANWVKIINKKGAIFMLSNSDPTNTDENDNFFNDLYKEFNINKVYAPRAINSKGAGRGKLRELLVTNTDNFKLNYIEEIAVSRNSEMVKGDFNMDLGQDKFIYTKSKETFEYLLNTLKDTIRGWDYFVNWAKVNKNVNNLEVSLNLLNYLIGKKNINEEFRKLLKQYPEVLKAIPILIASRDKNFKILKPFENEKIKFDIKEYDFSKKGQLTEDEINKAIEFTEKTGVLDIISNKKVKNLVDYVLGVEVGLDSNGRKNRSGTAMEDLVELFIKKICLKYDYEYIIQATPKKIKSKWNCNVKVDKASRRFDFAIYANDNLFLVETNYYGGGGSKLKATAGEYKTLYDLITEDGHDFIWITEGKGWITASKSLQETFEHNKYLLNLNMIENGVLEKILNRSIVL